MESESLDVTFPKMTPETKAQLVRSLYRQALIDIGYSPDYHLYDIDKSYLSHKQDRASGAYLQEIMDFYEKSLSPLEQRIFICDCLEDGRHYHWWWMEYCDSYRFYRGFSLVLMKIYQSI